MKSYLEVPLALTAAMTTGVIGVASGDKFLMYLCLLFTAIAVGFTCSDLRSDK